MLYFSAKAEVLTIKNQAVVDGSLAVEKVKQLELDFSVERLRLVLILKTLFSLNWIPQNWMQF